jgi:hypothetical protein
VFQGRLAWGLGLSALLHVLLFLLGLTLLPAVARRWGTLEPPPQQQVLTFRFRERFADVDETSRTDNPPDTPLLGRFDSQARDRVVDDRDTPIPAGGLRSTENTLPGDPDGGGTDVGTTAQPGGPGSATAAPDPAGAGIADALGSEIAMLTGRSDAAPARAGRGARTESELGEGGALQFGDYSFSTRAWDYEPYWLYMRERLYANWHPPAAYKDYGIINGGWTLVRATLDRRGRLIDARILGENGHQSLHPASLAAMLGAAPFRPLPGNFPEDSLVVTVRFIYLPPGESPPAGDWP